MQETSLESFSNIQKELGTRQKIVYSGFARFGILTNLEISKCLNIPINQITPRTNELVNMGYLAPHSKRICSISGRRSICWKVKI